MFGAPLRFDAPAPALVLDERLLDLPIVRDEAELDRYLRHSPADVLAQRDYGTTLADQVRNILERGARGDWPTSDEIGHAPVDQPPAPAAPPARGGHVGRRHPRGVAARPAITGLARGDAVDVAVGSPGLLRAERVPARIQALDGRDSGGLPVEGEIDVLIA